MRNLISIYMGCLLWGAISNITEEKKIAKEKNSIAYNKTKLTYKI